jgi:hypothetical protein
VASGRPAVDVATVRASEAFFLGAQGDDLGAAVTYPFTEPDPNATASRRSTRRAAVDSGTWR